MFRFAVRNLLSRPVRTILALLGLTVAVVGMVGLFSVAAGIDAAVADTFGRVPGLLAMQRGAPIPLFSRIPRAWAREIEQLPGVNAVSAEIWVRVNVINDQNIVSPPRFLFGADIEAHQKLKYGVYDRAMKTGRYLSLDDIGHDRCVVSQSVADEFGVTIGDSLNVNGRTFELVGIYKTGSLLLDTAVIVEQSVVRHMSLFDSTTVCSFYIEPTGEIPNDELVEWIRELFRGRDIAAWQPSSLLSSFTTGTASPVRADTSGNPLVDLVRSLDRVAKGHKLPDTRAPDDVSSTQQPHDTDGTAGMPDPTSDSVGAETVAQAPPPDNGPLDIRSAADWAERFDEFSSDLDLFLTLMTSLGLTIAVLSIINTMLMSVSERIIEFGILKANGWSRSDVMRLITCESAVLGATAGIFGAVLGFCLTIWVNTTWPDQMSLKAGPALLGSSILLSTALGVGAGLYPAFWATRMLPLDAMRRG